MAISLLRVKLGACIFLWTSSHGGASPSSYADLVAKTFLKDKEIEDVTTMIKGQVITRPCIYERRVWGYGGETWDLADRRAFREGRIRARGYVRKVLGVNLKPGATTAKRTGRLWSEVVKAPFKKPDGGVDNDGRPKMVELEHVELHNIRVKFALGMRTTNMVGMLHDAAWERRSRIEKEQGELGTAGRSGQWGCAMCRDARNIERT